MENARLTESPVGKFTRQVITALFDWIGVETLSYLFLLLVIFGSLVIGISDSVKGLSQYSLWPLVVTAMVIGWLVGRSSGSNKQAAGIGMTGAGLYLVLVSGRIGGLIVKFIVSGFAFVSRWVRTDFTANPAEVSQAFNDIGAGFAALMSRLSNWGANIVSGQEIFDPLPLEIVWGLIVWMVVIWGCFFTRKYGDAVIAALPAAALLVIIVALTGNDAGYLLPLLGGAFILKSLQNQNKLFEKWEASGVDYPPEVRQDTLAVSFGIMIVILVIAGLTPSADIYKMVDSIKSYRVPLEDSSRTVVDSFGLNAPEPIETKKNVFEEVYIRGLPTSHLIGSGPELSDQVVIEISVEGDGPDTPRYWRTLAYDQYNGKGWRASGTETLEYEAGEIAFPDDLPNMEIIRQQVTLVDSPGAFLYSAGHLITADQPFQVSWRGLDPSRQRYNIFGTAIETDQYRADSAVPIYTPEKLRAAGEDYPSWITRYLILPDSLPDRVRSLALDLTAAAPTPYDRATAIETFLRAFPYSLNVPYPPSDVDVADYFLFDLKQGYCDYYATSMIVLARAAGVPARLVTGYIAETRDPDTGIITITADQAHAWVEVYFPNYGWVEFEPTGGRAEILRNENAPEKTTDEIETPFEPITAYRARIIWLWAVSIFAGLILAASGGFIAWVRLDAYLMQRLEPEVTVEKIFRRLYPYGRRLGVPYMPGQTPSEYAFQLDKHLRANQNGNSPTNEIHILTRFVNLALFSPAPLTSEESKTAVSTWQTLRTILTLETIKQKISNRFHRG